MYLAGLFSILLIRRQLAMQEEQAKKTYEQLSIDHRWRTYSSLHEHFSSVPPEDLRLSAYKMAEDLGFIDSFNDRGRAIDEQIKNTILRQNEAWKIFRAYLDCFEEFSGAINVGLIDDDYAFALQGTRVVRNFTVFKPLIDHYQQTSGTAYCELQRVASRWNLKMNLKEVESVPMKGISNRNFPRIQPPS